MNLFNTIVEYSDLSVFNVTSKCKTLIINHEGSGKKEALLKTKKNHIFLFIDHVDKIDK